VRIDLGQIEICGSAHLGFSPVPEEGRWGRAFRRFESDLDVAVVSVGLFTRCWESLQDDPPQMAKLQRLRVLQDLFWGMFNPFILKLAIGREGNPFITDWWNLFDSLEVFPVKAVRGRIYRTEAEMNGYHCRSIRRAQDLILAGQLPAPALESRNSVEH
jgi:hypothetical protein